MVAIRHKRNVYNQIRKPKKGLRYYSDQIEKRKIVWGART